MICLHPLLITIHIFMTECQEAHLSAVLLRKKYIEYWNVGFIAKIIIFNTIPANILY